MKHINKAVNYSVLGSMGVVVMSALSGCEAPQEEMNKFLVIEEQANGRYVVVEEHPTDGETRAILRDKDGKERFLNNDEMKRLAQQEYSKVQSGQSELTQAPSGGSGMGLGGTILAAAAGALMGNMIANSLMNNSNFQKNQRMSNRAKSAYSRSAGSKSSKTTAKKSSRSFFGSSSRGSSSSRRGSFFGG